MLMKRYVKPAVALLLIASCAALYWALFRDMTAEQLRAYIQSFGSLAPLVYILAFTLLPVVFVPAQLLAPLSGLLFGLWGGCCYTLIGALLNSGLMFLISRYLMGDSLGAWLERRCPQKWRPALFSADGSNGFSLILLLRLIPAVPYNVINLGAGLTKIPFRQYLPASALGMIPGVFVYVNLGDKAADFSSPAFILAVLLLAALTAASLALARALRPGGSLRSLPILLKQRRLFSPVGAASMSRAESLFWPGCTLMTLGPQPLEGLYGVLKQEEPDMGYCTWCCGKPSLHLAPEKVFNARIALLRQALAANSVKRIYAACPNCIEMLRSYTQAEVLSVWPVLARHYPADKLDVAAGALYALHDPCPLRHDSETQEAVREIAAKAGARISELPHNRTQTICCGNHEMLMQTDPAKGRELRNKRLAELPGLPVISYCQGCVSMFRSNHKPALHLLELLWPPSKLEW